MRSIDADKLPRQKQLEAMGNGEYAEVEIVRGVDIDNAPTIEAEEVRHGKWVDVAKTEMFDKAGVKTLGIVYQCNRCGFIVNAVEGHIGQYNGCPQCRAKMEV